MNNKVVIIGVYFGNLPNYFELWRLSAVKNTGVDFLIITDQENIEISNNINVISMDISCMKALASEKLGISNISLDKPYKCCDFKPVYGVIFEDYIKGYDYWGHCDFDMIFGDLTGFFNKYDLYSYDKFLALGHLTMYRNTTEVLNRYKCKGALVDYRTVFTSNENFAFDEYEGITRIYIKNHYSHFTKRVFSDIASVHKRYRDIEQYPYDRKAKNRKMQIYYWENGHVFRKSFEGKKEFRDEYIYIHFKKRGDFEINFDYKSAKGFFITNSGFYQLSEEPDIQDVMKYNKYNPIEEIFEIILVGTKRFKKRLLNLLSERVR